MQLMQPKVQKSMRTGRPRSSSIVSTSLLSHAVIPANSGAAPMTGKSGNWPTTTGGVEGGVGTLVAATGALVAAVGTGLAGALVVATVVPATAGGLAATVAAITA